RCNRAYCSIDAWPQDNTKRSRSGQAGSAGLCLRKRVQSTNAAGASAIGVPGWPDWARSTASIASARTALMAIQAESDSGTVGWGRTGRVRGVSTVRDTLLRSWRPGGGKIDTELVSRQRLKLRGETGR